MKSSLVLVMLVFSTAVFADGKLDGYLVFEIEHYEYGTHQGAHDPKFIQKFKIPLTKQFMTNFSKPPIPRESMGTGFLCSAREVKPQPEGTDFAWWIRKTLGHRWAINMWGHGEENLSGTNVFFGYPGCSQDVVLKNLEDLDMSYMISYVKGYAGVNVSFTARYVKARDLPPTEHIPIPLVKRQDGSVIFPATESTNFVVQVRCLFQDR
jgi:hypothetical protein